jgi:mannose-6-phosphate isomerase-like protein (cupin superfamily)
MSKYDKVEAAWGFHQLIRDDEEHALKYLYLKDGFKTSKHFHKDKVESILVARGTLTVEFFPNENSDNYYMVVLEPHEKVKIPNGLVHRMSARNGVDTHYYEVSNLYLDDVERIEVGGKL